MNRDSPLVVVVVFVKGIPQAPRTAFYFIFHTVKLAKKKAPRGGGAFINYLKWNLIQGRRAQNL